MIVSVSNITPVRGKQQGERPEHKGAWGKTYARADQLLKLKMVSSGMLSLSCNCR